MIHLSEKRVFMKRSIQGLIALDAIVCASYLHLRKFVKLIGCGLTLVSCLRVTPHE